MPGAAASFCGTGYSGAEKQCILTPRIFNAAGSARPTIYLWGHGGDAGLLPTIYWNGIGRAPAEYNALPVISADFGGQLWGSDTAQARVSSLWTYFQSRGVGSTEVDIIAISMGAVTGLNWALANSGKVRRFIGVNPAVDLSDIYTNNRSGLQAEIGGVYGGAPPSNHDPAQNAAACDTAISGTIDLYYSTNDTVVIPATVTTFATAANATAHSLGAVGHSAGSLTSAEIAALLA